MILRSSPPSPFGRKIKIAAKYLGIFDGIEVRMTNTMDAEDSIRKENPLGKIPALILENGDVIYDSAVILEFFDAHAGGGKIIPNDGSRWQVLTLESLADGIIDAAILQIYELRFRPEDKRFDGWTGYQAEKVTRGLAHLEQHTPPEGVVNVGTISLACALGYLDFRFAGTWRASHPKLVAWLEAFAAAVPAFSETIPADPAPAK